MSMWRFFKLEEFNCRHCGDNKMQLDFVTKLDALRREVGFALPVTSGYRCPTHNQRVSTTGPDGPHTTGRAVDLAVRGAQAHEVLRVALQMGFTGIGVQGKGATRFIHLDDLMHGRPAVWSY
jgi:zinc D-Ala-D-Ala carboxypeptidase